MPRLPSPAILHKALAQSADTSDKYSQDLMEMLMETEEFKQWMAACMACPIANGFLATAALGFKLKEKVAELEITEGLKLV